MMGPYILNKLWKDDYTTIIKKDFVLEMTLLVYICVVSNMFYLMNGFNSDISHYISCMIDDQIPDDMAQLITRV